MAFVNTEYYEIMVVNYAEEPRDTQITRIFVEGHDNAVKAAKDYADKYSQDVDTISVCPLVKNTETGVFEHLGINETIYISENMDKD